MNGLDTGQLPNQFAVIDFGSAIARTASRLPLQPPHSGPRLLRDSALNPIVRSGLHEPVRNKFASTKRATKRQSRNHRAVCTIDSVALNLLH